MKDGWSWRLDMEMRERQEAVAPLRSPEWLVPWLEVERSGADTCGDILGLCGAMAVC